MVDKYDIEFKKKNLFTRLINRIILKVVISLRI